MATVTTAQLAAKIDSLTTAFQALILQATTDNPPPRKVRVLDIKKREQILEPGRVIYMAAVEAKGDQPNTVFDATICLFNAADDGKLLRCILPGTPQAIALQLGIGFETVSLAPQPLRTVARTPDDVQDAIDSMNPVQTFDLVGKTMADSPIEITASPGKSTFSIQHAEAFGKQAHWMGYRLPAGGKVTEEHGSGFTIVIHGFTEILFDGEGGGEVIKIADLPETGRWLTDSAPA